MNLFEYYENEVSQETKVNPANNKGLFFESLNYNQAKFHKEMLKAIYNVDDIGIDDIQNTLMADFLPLGIYIPCIVSMDKILKEKYKDEYLDTMTLNEFICKKFNQKKIGNGIYDIPKVFEWLFLYPSIKSYVKYENSVRNGEIESFV